jgi:hypothetical protein
LRERDGGVPGIASAMRVPISFWPKAATAAAKRTSSDSEETASVSRLWSIGCANRVVVEIGAGEHPCLAVDQPTPRGRPAPKSPICRPAGNGMTAAGLIGEVQDGTDNTAR